LENSHGAHCLYLMLERLGRRGRRKIVVKKHFEVVQLLQLQFFSPVSRCTRNGYFDLTKQQFIFFNFSFLFFFFFNGWVTQSVMANMPGMRSSGSAGRAGGGEGRTPRAAGREGACSLRTGPAAGTSAAGEPPGGKTSASAHGAGGSVRGTCPPLPSPPVSPAPRHGHGGGRGSAQSAGTGAGGCQLPPREGPEGLLGPPPSLTESEPPAAGLASGRGPPALSRSLFC